VKKKKNALYEKTNTTKQARRRKGKPGLSEGKKTSMLLHGQEEKGNPVFVVREKSSKNGSASIWGGKKASPMGNKVTPYLEEGNK